MEPGVQTQAWVSPTCKMGTINSAFVRTTVMERLKESVGTVRLHGLVSRQQGMFSGV